MGQWLRGVTVGLGRTWVFERRVLGVHPWPLSTGDGYVVDCADIIPSEVVITIGKIAVGQRVVTFGGKAFGIPHLLSRHCKEVTQVTREGLKV